jgi:hypothetical protein
VPGEGIAALVELAERPAFIAGPYGVSVPEPVRSSLELLMDCPGHGNILLLFEIGRNIWWM